MKAYSIIFSMIILGICVGCTPNIYIPGGNNVPLPGNEKELKVNGGLSLPGYFAEGSYAITNHIVALADFSSNSTKDSNTFSKYWIGEVGGGYYALFGKYGRFEALGGWGLGDRVANAFYHPSLIYGPHSDLERYLINCGYNHYFLQGDVAFSHKNIEIGFSARFDQISFTNLHYEKQTINGYTHGVESDSFLNFSKSEIFFEPCIFFDFGLKNVKLRLNWGIAAMVGPDQNEWANRQLYNPMLLSAGLTVDLFRKD